MGNLIEAYNRGGENLHIIKRFLEGIQAISGKMIGIDPAFNNGAFLGCDVDLSHGGFGICLRRREDLIPAIITRCYLHGNLRGELIFPESNGHAIYPYGGLTRATALLMPGASENGAQSLLISLTPEFFLTGDITAHPSEIAAEILVRQKTQKILNLLSSGSASSLMINVPDYAFPMLTEFSFPASTEASSILQDLEKDENGRIAMTDLSVFS